MIRSYVKKYIVLMIILVTISVISVLLLGKKQTIVFDVGNNITSIDQLDIKVGQDSKIVKITEQKLEDGKLYITVESVGKGKDYIDVKYENNLKSFSISHNFMVLSSDDDKNIGNFK